MIHRGHGFPALLATVLLAALAGPAGAYDVVLQDGRTLDARAVAFAHGQAVLDVGGQAVRLAPREIDYYATFRSNAGPETGNVVVFRTGSFLRFDSIRFDSGTVRLGVSDDATFTVPESLIDFEASVREGATVRLPQRADRPVALSRGGGDDGRSEDPADMTRAERREAVRSRRQSALERRREAAARRRAGDTADPSTADDEPPSSSQAGSRRSSPPARTSFPDDDSESTSDDADDADEPENPPGGHEPDPDGDTPEDDEPTQPEATGRVTVSLSTADPREVGGLQVELAYPETCTLVDLPDPSSAFMGFASDLTTAFNSGMPGMPQYPVNVAGFHTSSVRGPGEFLRLTFQWRGEAPTPDEFRIMRTVVTGPTNAVQTETYDDWPIALVVQ